LNGKRITNTLSEMKEGNLIYDQLDELAGLKIKMEAMEIIIHPSAQIAYCNPSIKCF
jgi:hypothetical protein